MHCPQRPALRMASDTPGLGRASASTRRTLLYGWLHTILTRSQRFSAAARTNLSGPNIRTRLGFEPLRLSEGDMKEEVTRRT